MQFSGQLLTWSTVTLFMFVTVLYACLILGQETNNYSERDMIVCNGCKWFGTYPLLGCENDWASITSQWLDFIKVFKIIIVDKCDRCYKLIGSMCNLPLKKIRWQATCVIVELPSSQIELYRSQQVDKIGDIFHIMK